MLRKATAAAAGLTVLAALTACTAGAGGGDDDETITLRYAFYAPIESFPGVQMEEWKKQIEARTDGQVEVELFAGATLLNTGDVYDGVTSGIADVGMDSPAYDTSRFPFSSVVNNPVGATDAASASKAFLDLLLEEQPPEYDGYEIITAFTTEPAYFQTEKPVRTVSEAKGLEVRASAAMVPVMERMDAAPVGMSMPDVAEALQTGVISGYVSSREVLQDFGLAEQVSYVTDYPLAISNSFVVVMDENKFAELPQDVQDVITELRPEMADFASSYHDDDNVQPALEFAGENGVEIVDVEQGDVANWDRIMTEAAEEWVAQHENADFDAEAVLERFRDLVEENSTAGE